MARVLILSLVFPPDGVSTAQIMGEIVLDLRAAGHDVQVITTRPHYNRDTTAEAKQPLRRRLGGLFFTSRYHGVPVFHTAMPRKGTSVLKRLLGWISFHLLSVAVALTAVRGPDVILAPSPPLTIGIAARLIARFRGACYIYNVQEVYPDVAVNLGLIRNRLLIRALERLESFVYDGAYALTVISDAMRERLLEKGVTPEKVLHVPNFVDVTDLRPRQKDNPFAREHGVAGLFVISYAGNVGPAQGLEVLLDAAECLGRDGLRFLVVGDGIARPTLQRRARERGLDAVRFIAHQPYERVPEIYGASDLCVVPQVSSIGATAAPSKIYRIMACGRPVLAVTSQGSELARLVQQAGCGITVSPEGQAVAQVVREAADHPEQLRAMGEAGRRFVVEHYSRSTVTGRYEALIREAAARPLRRRRDAQTCAVRAGRPERS